MVCWECRHVEAVARSSLTRLLVFLWSLLEDQLGSWSEGGIDSASYFRADTRSPVPTPCSRRVVDYADEQLPSFLLPCLPSGGSWGGWHADWRVDPLLLLASFFLLLYPCFQRRHCCCLKKHPLLQFFPTSPHPNQHPVSLLGHQFAHMQAHELEMQTLQT